MQDVVRCEPRDVVEGDCLLGFASRPIHRVVFCDCRWWFFDENGVRIQKVKLGVAVTVIRAT